MPEAVKVKALLARAQQAAVSIVSRLRSKDSAVVNSSTQVLTKTVHMLINKIRDARGANGSNWAIDTLVALALDMGLVNSWLSLMSCTSRLRVRGCSSPEPDVELCWLGELLVPCACGTTNSLGRARP